MNMHCGGLSPGSKALAVNVCNCLSPMRIIERETLLNDEFRVWSILEPYTQPIVRGLAVRLARQDDVSVEHLPGFREVTQNVYLCIELMSLMEVIGAH